MRKNQPSPSVRLGKFIICSVGGEKGDWPPRPKVEGREVFVFVFVFGGVVVLTCFVLFVYLFID